MITSRVVALVASFYLTANMADAATIIDAARQSGDFTALLKAGTVAGLAKALEGQGPYTLFAPSDAAFAKVSKAKLDALMNPSDLKSLKNALGAHLVTGVLSLSDIEAGLARNDAAVVMTINNMPLVFRKEGGQLTVNGAKLLKAPVRVDNGVIYTIDTVLLPPQVLQPAY